MVSRIRYSLPTGLFLLLSHQAFFGALFRPSESKLEEEVDGQSDRSLLHVASEHPAIVPVAPFPSHQ